MSDDERPPVVKHGAHQVRTDEGPVTFLGGEVATAQPTPPPPPLDAYPWAERLASLARDLPGGLHVALVIDDEVAASSQAVEAVRLELSKAQAAAGCPTALAGVRDPAAHRSIIILEAR